MTRFFKTICICALLVMPHTAAAQVDTDNDGMIDSADPCPEQARNQCYGAPAVDSTSGNVVRLNANASADECAGLKVDCNGDTWFADFGYNLEPKAGECDLPDGCVIAGIDTMFGCDDEQTQHLFRCEHSDRSSDPELSYSFAVGTGEFLVNLYFANTFTGTTMVGDRVFDIAAEGEVIHEDFDQIIAAGGSGTAVVRSAVVKVDDGVLDIEFLHGIENPAVKAIEVLARMAGPECGDGSLDDGEECDDGNLEDGDGCSSLCKVEVSDEPEGCGPGYWRRWSSLRHWQKLSPLSRFNETFETKRDWNRWRHGVQDMYVYRGLWMRYESCRKLAKHGVAALLNANSDYIDFAYSADEVREIVKDGFDSDQCKAAKRRLAHQNRGICVLKD